jgi:hypothetical protein
MEEEKNPSPHSHLHNLTTPQIVKRILLAIWIITILSIFIQAIALNLPVK